MTAIKRAYEQSSRDDGARFLVDHLWPRGVKKEALKLSGWLKAIAPSDKLRKWFAHDPAKWEEFQRRYFDELEKNEEALQPLLEAARAGKVTLVYGARDMAHNNAVVLKKFLEKNMPRTLT